jgi:hypothetical protein
VSKNVFRAVVKVTVKMNDSPSFWGIFWLKGVFTPTESSIIQGGNRGQSTRGDFEAIGDSQRAGISGGVALRVGAGGRMAYGAQGRAGIDEAVAGRQSGSKRAGAAIVRGENGFRHSPHDRFSCTIRTSGESSTGEGSKHADPSH